MKKFYLFVTAVIAAFYMTSCARYTVDAPLMGISNNSINTYVAADLDYSSAKPVSAEIESQTLFGFISLTHNGNKQLTNTNRYKGLTKPERQALYKAKTNSNVDIILEPEFTVEKHSWFLGAYKTRKVSVKGWGVNMIGIKEDQRGIPNSAK